MAGKMMWNETVKPNWMRASSKESMACASSPT
jgi:hypothetical protein